MRRGCWTFRSVRRSNVVRVSRWNPSRGGCRGSGTIINCCDCTLCSCRAHCRWTSPLWRRSCAVSLRVVPKLLRLPPASVSDPRSRCLWRSSSAICKYCLDPRWSANVNEMNRDRTCFAGETTEVSKLTLSLNTSSVKSDLAPMSEASFT